MQLILTPPPEVTVILKKISFNCGNAEHEYECCDSNTFHLISIRHIKMLTRTNFMVRIMKTSFIRHKALT